MDIMLYMKEMHNKDLTVMEWQVFAVVGDYKVKVIDQFDIFIKAPPDKTYYFIHNTIKLQYVLRPGDKIAGDYLLGT